MSATVVFRYIRRLAVVRKVRRAARGFTLLELVLVLLIFGVLSEVGIVGYRNYRERVESIPASVEVGAVAGRIYAPRVTTRMLVE